MKRWIRIFALTCCVGACAATGVVHAESLDNIFRSGNEAFAHGDYANAAQRYQRLVEAGIRDPDVYFNLGLAHARGGVLGHAVLDFEQTLRIRPGDQDAASALAQARAAIGKRRAEQQGEALVETRPPLAEALVRPYTEDTLAWLLLIGDAALFLCLLARQRASADSTRTGLAVAVTLLGLASACVFAGLLVKRGVLHEGQPAVVLRDGAELREAPDPRALTRARAPEGGSARVLASDGNFVQVRTAAGTVGWLPDSDVGMIVD
jgi:tetratricopeptide (TPR) repeat protein